MERKLCKLYTTKDELEDIIAALEMCDGGDGFAVSEHFLQYLKDIESETIVESG